MSTERRYTPIGSIRVHSVHSGAGRPVVLLHGLSGSHRWWRYTLPELSRRFRTHIPELVGFGATRAPGALPDIPRMAALVADWMGELDLEPAHLIGHSMGGQIAIHIAARWPERVDRLVLADAAGLPRERRAAEVSRLASELVPPRAWGAPTFLPTIAIDAVRAGPRTLWTATRNLLEDDVTPLLGRIRSPTLLVWGALDPLIPLEHARIMSERIPGARLVVLTDAAHNPMCDRPHEFNRAVIDHLDAVA